MASPTPSPDAAQDVYGQARDSAADVTDAAQTAARRSVGSVEAAIRKTIETQPYTAAAVALGIGWRLPPLQIQSFHLNQISGNSAVITITAKANG